jgi:hypothetical protein
LKSISSPVLEMPLKRTIKSWKISRRISTLIHVLLAKMHSILGSGCGVCFFTTLALVCVIPPPYSKGTLQGKSLKTHPKRMTRRRNCLIGKPFSDRPTRLVLLYGHFRRIPLSMLLASTIREFRIGAKTNHN